MFSFLQIHSLEFKNYILKGVERKLYLEKQQLNKNLFFDTYYSKLLSNIDDSINIYKFYYKIKQIKNLKFYLFLFLYKLRYLGLLGIFLPSKLYVFDDIEHVKQKKRIFISNKVIRAQVPKCLLAYDIKLKKKIFFFSIRDYLWLIKKAFSSSIFYMNIHKQCLVFEQQLDLIKSDNKHFYFEEGGSYITCILIGLRNKFKSVKGFQSVYQDLKFSYPLIFITNIKIYKLYLENKCKKAKFIKYENNIFNLSHKNKIKFYDIGYVRPLTSLYDKSFIYKFDLLINEISKKFKKKILVSLHPQEIKNNNYKILTNQIDLRADMEFSDYEFIKSCQIIIGDFSSLFMLAKELGRKYYACSPMQKDIKIESYFNNLNDLKNQLYKDEFRQNLISKL